VEPPAPAPAPVVTKGKTSKPNAKTSKAAIAKSTKTKSAAGNKGGFKKNNQSGNSIRVLKRKPSNTVLRLTVSTNYHIV
jgi:hypothetical protein